LVNPFKTVSSIVSDGEFAEEKLEIISELTPEDAAAELTDCNEDPETAQLK
jgi:hypothetical protein